MNLKGPRTWVYERIQRAEIEGGNYQIILQSQKME